MDLKTAGVITLDADDVTGDAFISAGSVKLEADQLHIYLSGGTVKYLIEATDGQNGEISLKKTGSLNSFDLDNGNNINVTDAFFKAKDTFLSSNGNSNSNSSSGRIVLVGETIAEGNLELETVKDVTIRAKKRNVKVDAYGQAHIHSSLLRLFSLPYQFLLFSSFFLICNSFLLTLTSTSIVLCALASQRQTNTVTNTPVTSDIHQTLDVQLNF